MIMRRMRWTVHVTRIGKKRNMYATGFLWENLSERNQLDILGASIRMLLK
jgi:hypothetical protein